MSIALESSVIRILFPDGRTAGAGFLVAPGMAVTCAHVINTVGLAPGKKVDLGTVSGEPNFTAEILEKGWSPEELDDIAFLQLEGTPGNLQPVSLSTAIGRDAHLFSTLGFPPDENYGADRVTGQISGIIPSQVKGRADLLKFEGREIRPGMSGGPVWDTQSDRVVGMVCEIKDRQGVRRAYGVTAETIASSCPDDLILEPFVPELKPRDIQKLLAEILGLLNRPTTQVEIAGEVRDSVVISGDGNLVSFSLQDNVLVQGLERKLIRKRNLKSYLLWLTVRPDFLKWNKLFVPLQGQIELPLCYSEITQDQQGQARFKDIEITQALQEHEAFVILGQPGAGKTTTLQKIGFEQARAILAGEELPIPLFVRLPQQAGRTPEKFLAEEWNRFSGSLFEDQYTGGRLLILVDGINELPRANREQQLKAWRLFVDEALQLGHQVVFTGREMDYFNLLDLPRVLVKPLDPERIRDYLVRRDAVGLYDQITDLQNRLWELAGNPFYLNVLVDAYQSNHQQLTNRGRLMEWFIQECFKREEILAHEGWMPRAIQTSALSKLAFTIQEDQTKSTTWNLVDARAALPASLETDEGEVVPIVAADLFRFARGASILDFNPDLRSKIRFFHHLLMEYFAAGELLERFNSQEDLSRLWECKRMQVEMPPSDVGEWDPLPLPPSTGWEETTILAAGLIKEPERLIAAVRAVNPVLAGRCLDEAGLAAVRPLRLGGLHVGLKTENQALADELDACRQELLHELYNPQIHLRARIPAGLTLGRLGDPRLELREKDGVRFIVPDLVPVSAGRYTIGSQDDDQEAYSLEKPAFEIDLPAFSIAKRPVTNAEFACFIEAGGYQDERWWQTDLARRWLKGEEVAGGQFASLMEQWRFLKPRQDWEKILENLSYTPDNIKNWGRFLKFENEEDALGYLQRNQTQKSREKPNYWDDQRFNNPSQPVVGLTWFEANAYCAWLSTVSSGQFRLSNEFEWEAAARGKDGREYAWEGDWDQDKANTIEGRVMRTTPVGCYAAADGRGPHGEEDQSGNVWEWTGSLYISYDATDADREDANSESQRVLRGGSWDDSQRVARCAYRFRFVPDYFDDLGFRLLSPGAF